jgi:hypothetical protein
MKIKMRVDYYTGAHVEITFFVGPSGDYTCANVGKLTMRVPDFQAFCTTMLLGAKLTHGEHEVEIDEAMFVEQVKTLDEEHATPMQLAIGYLESHPQFTSDYKPEKTTREQAYRRAFEAAFDCKLPDGYEPNNVEVMSLETASAANEAADKVWAINRRLEKELAKLRGEEKPETPEARQSLTRLEQRYREECGDDALCLCHYDADECPIHEG